MIVETLKDCIWFMVLLLICFGAFGDAMFIASTATEVESFK